MSSNTMKGQGKAVKCSAWKGTIRGVLHRPLFARAEAPPTSNTLITSACPSRQAAWSGVSPRAVRPAVENSAPFQALKGGANTRTRPKVKMAVLLSPGELPAASRARAAAACPQLLAVCSGERPSMSLAFGSAPATSSPPMIPAAP